MWYKSSQNHDGFFIYELVHYCGLTYPKNAALVFMGIFVIFILCLQVGIFVITFEHFWDIDLILHDNVNVNITVNYVYIFQNTVYYNNVISCISSQVYFSAVEKWIILQEGFEKFPGMCWYLPPLVAVLCWRKLPTFRSWVECCITLNRSVGFGDAAELWTKWLLWICCITLHLKPI